MNKNDIEIEWMCLYWVNDVVYMVVSPAVPGVHEPPPHLRPTPAGRSDADVCNDKHINYQIVANSHPKHLYERGE